MDKIVLRPDQHDRIVREEALRLLHEGFKVQARLGHWFSSPPPIHGYRPDISATKNNKHVIVEVTKGSVDWPKTSALERFAQENPEVDVRIISPTAGDSNTHDKKAAEQRQRFLIAVAKLLGIEPRKDSILYGALLCPEWLLDEIIDSILQQDGTFRLTLSSFNRLMVNCRRPLATEDFFNWAFSGVTTIEEFERAVDTYRIHAMWLFGNFKYAYRRFALCTHSELTDLVNKSSMKKPDKFLNRAPFDEVMEIREADLPLLGYLSSAKLDTCLMLETLAKTASDEKDFQSLLEALPSKARERLKDHLQSIDFSNLSDLSTRMKGESDVLLARQEEAREIGRRNTKRYLSLPFLDVYVATSMRETEDFVSQQRFTKAVFEHESIKDLNLRYFDPTLSYVDDRATKGLIECLMLQRASVTLYNAAEKDTMGKDSELAATLAQGKPVIVYVPQGPKLDKRADAFRLDHPLGLQIDHDTGVAHGILVARTPEHCAKLLRGILLNSLDLQIRHEGGLYLLEEQSSGCILRVVSGDALLTHAFWTYFRDSQIESEPMLLG